MRASCHGACLSRGLLYPSHGRASLVPNPSARLTSQHSPTLAYTRLHSPAIARASLATRACLPAMAIHPMNPMHPHASSCIACIRMPLHVSTCPTRVPSVRPPSRHKAPGVQHPSGPHAIRSSELDCCQSYSTPPSKQVRASRRTATSIHSSQHRIRTVTHTAVHSHTRKPFFCSFFVSDVMVACPHVRSPFPLVASAP